MLYRLFWRFLWSSATKPWSGIEAALGGRESLCGPYQTGVLEPMLARLHPGEEVTVRCFESVATTQAELGDKSADFFVTVGGVPTWRDSKDIDTRGEWAVAGRGTTAMWSYQIAAFFKLSENQKEMSERTAGPGRRLHSVINTFKMEAFGDYLAVELYLTASGRQRGGYYKTSASGKVQPRVTIAAALAGSPFLVADHNGVVRLRDEPPPPSGIGPRRRLRPECVGLIIKTPKSMPDGTSVPRPTESLVEALQKDPIVAAAVIRRLLVPGSQSQNAPLKGRVLGLYNFV